jgi:hypothetical protein
VTPVEAIACGLAAVLAFLAVLFKWDAHLERQRRADARDVARGKDGR